MQCRLEKVTAEAAAARTAVLRIDQTILELQQAFPPARLEVARLKRQLEQLHQNHDELMAEVVELEEHTAAAE